MLEGDVSVAIVGAGPAGCAAAHALAQLGIAGIVLLERGAPGKDKPCGDAFLPDAVSALERLGIDAAALAALGGVPFDEILLRAAGKPVWRTGWSGATRGWVIGRAGLDQALRDAVAPQVTVRHGSRVNKVAPRPAGGWALHGTAAKRPIEIRARAVILACGATNRLARDWGLDGAPTLSMSLSSYVSGHCDVPIFDFMAGGAPGYGWRFPASSTTANVGYCAIGRTASLRRDFEHYLAATGSVGGRGGVGWLWSGQGAAWHHPQGLASCGDAAGLIDPLTGEGLGAALESGHAAGEAIARFLLDDAVEREGGALGAYSDWVRTTYATRYRLTPVRRVWARLCGLGAV